MALLLAAALTGCMYGRQDTEDNGHIGQKEDRKTEMPPLKGKYRSYRVHGGVGRPQRRLQVCSIIVKNIINLKGYNLGSFSICLSL